MESDENCKQFNVIILIVIYVMDRARALKNIFTLLYCSHLLYIYIVYVLMTGNNISIRNTEYLNKIQWNLWLLYINKFHENDMQHNFSDRSSHSFYIFHKKYLFCCHILRDKISIAHLLHCRLIDFGCWSFVWSCDFISIKKQRQVLF